ncbi:MAG TPA: 3-phosphoshikimate 1-carboxyvinyltransferase [Acidobacteriota bacterium]|nr:3-phosphoshikimate 1-carboxyvinyltransferase [Acidobacteriota bacterium]
MTQTLSPAASLSGTVLLPGDKSISHRYAMLAAIAEGTSVVENFAASRDCHSTLECMQSLGAEVQESNQTVTVRGRGLRGLTAPGRVLDAGNSGTTIRLLSGILAGHPFESSITGDESLSNRPMGRVIRPLRMMGAEIESRERDLPPLRIRGGSLKGIRYSLPVASAQVKSCVLFAGLYGDAPTAVEETISTRDHTEIALREFGATLRVQGNWIEVEPGPRLQGRHLVVPGDLSGAAFFLVAAALVPNSELALPGVGLNGRRRELLDYLLRAGMDLKVENETVIAGEPRGDLRVRYSSELLDRALPPIQGEEVASLIDEIPVLAVLGSQAAGGLTISDARELRVKESDRISAIVSNLRAMGIDVDEKPDGLSMPGGQQLKGAEIVTRNDHRIAMAFAIAALAARGETHIHNPECADVSFPGFWTALTRIIHAG